jgi:ribosomal protein S20
MNIWAKPGLDLSDSTFVKIYDSANRFNEKDRFNELCGLLASKIDKLAMKKLMKVTQSD